VRTAFAIPPHMATVLTKSSDIDLVTESDRKVEDLLTRGLLSTFPDHKFVFALKSIAF
jgi:fructose-1,6-bisphosphatase/inositol monophosphatase family enzyme